MVTRIGSQSVIHLFPIAPFFSSQIYTISIRFVNTRVGGGELV